MDYYKNIAYFISHIFLFSFFYLFTIHRFSKRKTFCICICALLSLGLSDCLKLNVFPDSDLCYVLVTVFQILVAQLTNLYISKNRDGRVVFLGLTASNYVIAGSVVSLVLYILTKHAVLSLAGSTMVHASILFFLFKKLKNIWLGYFEKEYIKNWWELCLIPVFFYCGFSSIAFFPYNLYENSNNILGIMIFIVTMFVSYVVVLRYVESEFRRNDMYWKNLLSECYIKDLENQYLSMEKFEQNLKILRHDIRHYSGMIENLLDQKEYDEVKKVVRHINDAVDENKIVKYSNNLVINTIIINIMERARSYGIKVNLDATIAKDLPVDNYEFAMVIANLFDNALLSVKDLDKEKRYVDANIQCTQHHLFIDMKNEYEKEITMDSVTGLPKSRKGKNHGFGMQSVQAFTEKTGGNIGCYCKNGIFQIIIIAKF